MSGPRTESALGRWLVIAASIVVMATVVAAIVVMGSPSAQRDRRLDQTRVRDLDRIADAVQNHAERRGALPTDLATLANRPGQWISFVDPQDGSPYAYAVTGAQTYRLCAVFTTDTAKTRSNADFGTRNDWIHGIGRQCFDRKIKKK